MLTGAGEHDHTVDAAIQQHFQRMPFVVEIVGLPVGGRQDRAICCSRQALLDPRDHALGQSDRTVDVDLLNMFSAVDQRCRAVIAILASCPQNRP